MIGNNQENSPQVVPLPKGQFDILVVGGGIVGAGIARDAALRGLRTLIIDQQDFASGTSGRSSRLLHGGIRYLAQAEFKLVREASREKMIVQRIASHIAQPLAFIFPTRKKSQWSYWKLAFGVKLYDLLCGRRNLGASQLLGLRQTLELLPGLYPENLTGAVRYFDGLTNDARLTIDSLRSARDNGAAIYNYVRFVGAVRKNALWHCEIENAENHQRSDITAKCVINAAGPWAPTIPNSKTALRLTKGVHLVVNRSRLPLPTAVVLTEGNRILFGIPWGERVILGTTDTDFSGSIDSPTCDPVDQQYILDVVNGAFPHVQLESKDIVSTWAGIRPLVAGKNGCDPSDMSRRHNISMSHSGWWDITGGKLTSYRLMAEETLDAVTRFLKLPKSKCRTAELPLLLNQDMAEASGILPPAISQKIVNHYCRAEWAKHLDDVMIRRTSWRYYHPDHLTIAATVVDWMSDAMGWNVEIKRQELARYRQLTSLSYIPPPHLNAVGEPQSARRQSMEDDSAKARFRN